MRKQILIIIAVFIILNSSFFILNCMCQWQPDVRITTSPGNSRLQGNTNSIATNGLIIHVVWFDDRDGNYEIYYKQSTDNGIHWGSGTRLTNNTGASQNPSIDVSGSNIHIVWFDDRDGNEEIYYKRSTNGGANWGSDIRLTNNSSASYMPRIEVSGSVVTIVWGDYRNGNWEIFYKNSTDGGNSWSSDIRLTNNEPQSKYPDVAVSDNAVFVVWEDNRDGNFEIYYKYSPDGYTWGPDIRLTNDVESSSDPSIAVSSLYINVVWSDNRDGNREIYCKRSTNGGTNWETDMRLTTNSASSFHPSLVMSGSNVHIVWDDNRDGNEEIYYNHSTNYGSTWTSATRLTNNTAVSIFPSMAVSGSVLNVVWQDTRDGNYSIYYKRNPTGNVGIQNISSEVPEEFALEQNYPNPFNQSTMFNVRCAIAGIVQVKVLDITGREVTTLVNEYLQPGTYEVRFDAGNLPSGIYFYQLKSENFTDTKKLILLK